MPIFTLPKENKKNNSLNRDVHPPSTDSNSNKQHTHTSFKSLGEAVLTEIEMTGGQLRKVSNSNGATFSSDDGKFGIRFILKSSYKIPKSNYVNNVYVAQLLVSDQSTIKKEYAADKVKLEAREQKLKPETPKIEQQGQVEL